MSGPMPGRLEMIFACGCRPKAAAMALSRSAIRRRKTRRSVATWATRPGGGVLSGQGNGLIGGRTEDGVGELGHVQGTVTAKVGHDLVAPRSSDLLRRLEPGEEHEGGDVGERQSPFHRG